MDNLNPDQNLQPGGSKVLTTVLVVAIAILTTLLIWQVYAAGELRQEVEDLQEERSELEDELDQMAEVKVEMEEELVEESNLVETIMVPVIEPADPDLLDQHLDSDTRAKLRKTGELIGCGDRVVFEKRPLNQPLSHWK